MRCINVFPSFICLIITLFCSACCSIDFEKVDGHFVTIDGIMDKMEVQDPRLVTTELWIEMKTEYNSVKTLISAGRNTSESRRQFLEDVYSISKLISNLVRDFKD